jgi:hypothetical protein
MQAEWEEHQNLSCEWHAGCKYVPAYGESSQIKIHRSGIFLE